MMSHPLKTVSLVSPEERRAPSGCASLYMYYYIGVLCSVVDAQGGESSAVRGESPTWRETSSVAARPTKPQSHAQHWPKVEPAVLSTQHRWTLTYNTRAYTPIHLYTHTRLCIRTNTTSSTLHTARHRQHKYRRAQQCRKRSTQKK